MLSPFKKNHAPQTRLRMTRTAAKSSAIPMLIQKSGKSAERAPGVVEVVSTSAVITSPTQLIICESVVPTVASIFILPSLNIYILKEYSKL